MAEHETNLPGDDQLAEGERESQDVFRSRFRSSRFIPRVPDKAPDRGADGSIELRRVLLGDPIPRATGKRAWFQLKHTSSPTRLADGSVSYPIETKNINYLGNYPCPFYVLYVRPTQELLFRWWRDVRGELDRERPGWNEQHEVNVRFSRLVDEDVLREIEIEIDSYASQVARLFDGPRFIRDLRPEGVRRLLEPDPLFVGRADELGMLQERMGRGRVVPIIGAPDAGKSELVRQCLGDPKVLTRLEKSLGAPLALLVVDVGAHIEPRLLRGLAYGIGLHKSLDIGPDEATKRARERAVLLGQDLPGRAQGQHLLAVIENAHHCLDQFEERRDLNELLASEPFRSGCAVIVSRSGSSPDGKGTRTVQAETEVGFLPPGDAANLLERLAVESSLSSSVVDVARECPELLLPGVVRRGAGAFNVRSAAGRIAPTSESLFDELVDATSHVVDAVLVEVGCEQLWPGAGSEGSLGTLIAMSVLGRQAISAADLRSACLPIPPFLKLHQAGWIEQVGSNAYRLTGFGCRSLRRKFKHLIALEAPESDAFRVVAEALQRLVDTIASGLGEEGFDEFAQTIEEAIAWARESGMSGTRVEAVLMQTLLPYVVDDIFFPVPQEGAAPVHHELRTLERPTELAGAAAELVLAVRSGVAVDEFLSRLRGTAEAAAGTTHLLAIHIRALDTAAFLGQRRYHRYREILDIRQKLLGRLLNLNDAEAADFAVLKWSASWILSIADLAVGVGETQLARATSQAAKLAVARLPQSRTSYGVIDRLWLTSRLAQIESRLQVEPSQRVEKLREAMDSSFAALAIAPAGARWIRFALRAAHRLSEELRNDEERDQLLNDTYRRLAAIFGDDTGWPLVVRAQATALARDIGSLSGDPERRLQQVRRGLDLFEPATADAKALARLGDTRSLLVLARAHAFAAVCNDEIDEASAASTCRQEALHLARDALNAAASAGAWELYLRLLDEQESAGPEVAWHRDPLGGPRFGIGPSLSESIKEARAWLANVSFWDAEDGRLALWCLQRKWQSEGSLERLAARKQDPNEPWDSLDSAAKRRVLARKHRERQAALDAIERKSGPVLELCVARMRTEAQFQRLLAIYGSHVLNADAVLGHLNAAKKLWPDSHALLAEEGRFRRYVWDYPGAIVALRRVVTTAPMGRVRREAAVDLVEVLLTATAHCERVEFDDGAVADGRSLVAEARVLLGELLGFRNVSREVAILRDRVDLEAGIALDWGTIDDAFQAVVGDAFTTTLIGNLDELLAREAELPEGLADLVLADFTSAEVLRGLGSLYLRRAELGATPDPVADCRKAYDAFLACRVLEMAWAGSGKESATTSYQRGRAIIAAAKATGRVIPFEADLEGKRSLVHLASALFSRAVSLTVGLFHVEAKRRQAEAARLQHSLNN